ncbi:hypothetical protein Emag_002087 [Eimeria magna]
MSFSFSIKKASSGPKAAAIPAAAAGPKGGGAPRGPLKEFQEAAEAEEERAQQEAARPRLSSFSQKTERKDKEKLEALLRENPEALAYDEVYDKVSSGSAKEQQQKSQARRLYLGYTEDIKDKIEKDGATADALAAEAGPPPHGGPSPTTAGSPGGPLPPPRFIGKLLVQAQRRQIEREIIQERQLQKEREREGAPADEVFVTGAYKQRLEERRRVQQELEMQEARDAARAPDKQTDLSSFHAYLLKSGAATRSAAATTPNTAAAATATPTPPSSPPPPAAAAAAAAATRMATPAAVISPAAGAAPTKSEPALSPAACKPEIRLSPPQKQQQPKHQQQQEQQEQQQQQAGEAKGEEGISVDRSSSSRSRSGLSPIDKDAVLPFKRSAAPKTLPVPEKLSAEALAGARARYLARKKQKTGTD